MAKRGYRGKHPYDDMKVSPSNNKISNRAKHTDEYAKLGSKFKYEYIKSHGGAFDPQATAVVHFGGVATAAETVTIVSTDGTSKAYAAKAGAQVLTTDPASFSIATDAAANAQSLKECIEAANIPAEKAICDDAIDTTGQLVAAADSSIIFTIPAAFGGGADGTAVTINLDVSETTGAVGGANLITIGCDSVADDDLGPLIIKAINGIQDANIAFATSGAGKNGIDGIDAETGSSASQVKLTAHTAGIVGNATGLIADGGDQDLVDDADFTGGAAEVVPGHSGKISVAIDSATLTLTQIEPGPDGHTTIVVSADEPDGGSNQLTFANG